MKSRQPKWYEEVQKLIEETVNWSWNLVEKIFFILKKWTQEEGKAWIITGDKMFGKMTSHRDRMAIISHWQINEMTKKLSRCTGCAQNCLSLRKKSLKESRNYIEEKSRQEKVGKIEIRQHKGLREIDKDQWYKLRRKVIELRVLKIRMCSSEIIIGGVSRPAVRVADEELVDVLEFITLSFS
ncbi:7805_t:CDS:2 [Gigaspora margarita]|uniref:7805_t:CDS:1 n=1 Tax=Gigaspora margarita TaxID=4874 RepID=A0ABN7UAS1_GIGMA|nr:7805_t:CDS:2 [Gigaspora margarita]